MDRQIVTHKQRQKGVQALCKGAHQSKDGIAVINSSESRRHCSAAHVKQDVGQSFCGRKPIPHQWEEGQEGFAAFERGLSRTGQWELYWQTRYGD